MKPSQVSVFCRKPRCKSTRKLLFPFIEGFNTGQDFAQEAAGIWEAAGCTCLTSRHVASARGTAHNQPVRSFEPGQSMGSEMTYYTGMLIHPLLTGSELQACMRRRGIWNRIIWNFVSQNPSHSRHPMAQPLLRFEF